MEAPQNTAAKPPKKKPTDPTEPPDQQPPENPPPENPPPEQPPPEQPPQENPPEQPIHRQPQPPADPLPRLLDLMRRQMEVTLRMTGHMAEGQAAEWLRDLAAFQEEWRRLVDGESAI